MFDKLTYWNLETPPNSDDTVVMAMDWPELAEAVSLFLLYFFLQLSLKRLVLIKAKTNLCHLVMNVFLKKSLMYII